MILVQISTTNNMFAATGAHLQRQQEQQAVATALPQTNQQHRQLGMVLHWLLVSQQEGLSPLAAPAAANGTSLRQHWLQHC
jgi:hypothetical protein